jgi:hypothetical protein
MLTRAPLTFPVVRRWKFDLFSAADTRRRGAAAIAPGHLTVDRRKISVLVFGLRLEMKFAFCVTSRRLADGSAKWAVSGGFFMRHRGSSNQHPDQCLKEIQSAALIEYPAFSDDGCLRAYR